MEKYGFFEMVKIGASQFAEDSLYQFNYVDLSHNVETIHEVLDKRGKRTASINSIIYRGNYEHTLKTPKILAKTTALPDHFNTFGPKMLSVGAFIRQDEKMGKGITMTNDELKALKNLLNELEL